MKIRILIVAPMWGIADGLPAELTLEDGSTVDDAIAALNDHLPDGETLPDSCLIAVGGRHRGTVGTRLQLPLKDGDELELITPAGGG